MSFPSCRTGPTTPGEAVHAAFDLQVAWDDLIAMEICGSSRPASGAEHLISHALDELSVRPRLHGPQVDMATYLVSHSQGQGDQRIASLFDHTGFIRHSCELRVKTKGWRSET